MIFEASIQMILIFLNESVKWEIALLMWLPTKTEFK